MYLNRYFLKKKKRHTDGQEAHENMLNSAHYLKKKCKSKLQ